MDPLHPITPPGSPALPSRRVPPVDRLRRISREGDHPERESSGRDGERREPSKDRPEGETGDGHVDIRV